MGESYKAFRFIINSVVFKITSPVLLFFVVTSKGGEEGESVDIGSRFLLSFISHFSPASKDDIDVNIYFIRHYAKHLMHAVYFYS